AAAGPPRRRARRAPLSGRLSRAGEGAAGMSALRALAPAKINLGLALGPLRPGDERHEIVTVMQSISLADELSLAPGPDADGADEVVCAGVPGPPAENLAAVALRGFRTPRAGTSGRCA